MFGLRRFFPGSGVSGGMEALLGIVFIAIGVIVGATFVPPVVTNLVTAHDTTGITDAAASMTDIGQLVGVLALTVGPALAGMYLIFKGVTG